MRYTVRISRQASRDLTEIFRYIENREQSAPRAEKLTQDLLDEAMGLAQFPYRGHVIKRPVCLPFQKEMTFHRQTFPRPSPPRRRRRK